MKVFQALDNHKHCRFDIMLSRIYLMSSLIESEIIGTQITSSVLS